MTARRLGGLLFLALALPACADLGYYVQASRGQTEIEERARPLAEVLADPATPGDLRTRLESASRLLAFAAEELGLPGGAAFQSYADLGRPYAVWNVYAAPELSLRPRQWCFPFAGCVTYRGYFAQAEARALADSLAAAGDDVHVGGVAAYSTLGWFRDPILSTFVGYDGPDLARLLFHELAHRVVYVADDAAFNESFATAVEEEGAARWLGRCGTEAQRRDDEARALRRADVGRLVEATRRRLEALYASGAPEGVKRVGKAGLLRELRAEYEDVRAGWGGYPGYDAWFDEGLNNARLSSVVTYRDLVPGFRRLLAREDGDLGRFYAAVKRLAARPRDERRGALAAKEMR